MKPIVRDQKPQGTQKYVHAIRHTRGSEAMFSIWLPTASCAMLVLRASPRHAPAAIYSWFPRALLPVSVSVFGFVFFLLGDIALSA